MLAQVESDIHEERDYNCAFYEAFLPQPSPQHSLSRLDLKILALIPHIPPSSELYLSSLACNRQSHHPSSPLTRPSPLWTAVPHSSPTPSHVPLLSGLLCHIHPPLPHTSLSSLDCYAAFIPHSLTRPSPLWTAMPHSSPTPSHVPLLSGLLCRIHPPLPHTSLSSLDCYATFIPHSLTRPSPLWTAMPHSYPTPSHVPLLSGLLCHIHPPLPHTSLSSLDCYATFIPHSLTRPSPLWTAMPHSSPTPSHVPLLSGLLCRIHPPLPHTSLSSLDCYATFIPHSLTRPSPLWTAMPHSSPTPSHVPLLSGLLCHIHPPLPHTSLSSLDCYAAFIPHSLTRPSPLWTAMPHSSPTPSHVPLLSGLLCRIHPPLPHTSLSSLDCYAAFIPHSLTRPSPLWTAMPHSSPTPSHVPLLSGLLCRIHPPLPHTSLSSLDCYATFIPHSLTRPSPLWTDMPHSSPTPSHVLLLSGLLCHIHPPLPHTSLSSLDCYSHIHPPPPPLTLPSTLWPSSLSSAPVCPATLTFIPHTSLSTFVSSQACHTHSSPPPVLHIFLSVLPTRPPNASSCIKSSVLTGSLPAALFALPNLQHLLLDGNLISGTLPSSLGSFASLIYLAMVLLAVPWYYWQCHGATGSAMVLLAVPWCYWQCHGATGSAMVLLAVPRCYWQCQGATGSAMVLLAVPWCYWQCHGATGSAMVLLAVPWCYWQCHGATGSAMVLLAVPWCYWQCHGTTGSAKVLLAVPWCYWQCQGATGSAMVLLAVPWCYWQCHGATGSAMVLLAVPWCYWQCHGATGSAMVLLAVPWCYWQCHGATGSAMVLLAVPWYYWQCQGATGSAMVLLAVPRCYWQCHGATGSAMVLLAVPWCYWQCHGATGSAMVLLAVPWCYWQCHGATGSAMVLLAVPWCYWQCHGATGSAMVLLAVPRCYWQCHGATGSAMVLLAVPWCYWQCHGATGSAMVLLAVPWCYWQCHGATGSAMVLLAVPWCYWQCHGATGSAMVLLAVPWCFWQWHTNIMRLTLLARVVVVISGTNAACCVDFLMPYLGRNSLSGSIPAFLSNIRGLKHLMLDYNEFTGEIPYFLSDLTNLEALDVSRNSLTGNIPETLGNLRELRYLSMSQNTLSGLLPSELSSLQHLELCAVQSGGVTETATSFGVQGRVRIGGMQLYGLEKLACIVDGNQLVGQLPSLKRMAALKEVAARGNFITSVAETPPA
ncbi:unnamed protein product, partial [Closterium sp. NIES-64]